MITKLLVYGTLKKGYSNHRILSDATFLQEVIVGPYTMFNLGAYPACTLEPSTMIQAELYEVNKETMDRCDLLEGYPAFYTRHVVRYGPEPGDEAWMYFINREKMSPRTPVVETGVWKSKYL